MKYLGQTLGCHVRFDSKLSRVIIPGRFDLSSIVNAILSFFNKFLMCPNCNQPDIQLIVKKGIAFRKCFSCGATTKLDIKEKMTTYIISNPPPKYYKMKKN